MTTVILADVEYLGSTDRDDAALSAVEDEFSKHENEGNDAFKKYSVR